MAAPLLLRLSGTLSRFEKDGLFSYLEFTPENRSPSVKPYIGDSSKRGYAFAGTVLTRVARAVIGLLFVGKMPYGWMKRQVERRGANEACGPLVSKNARMAWWFLIRKGTFRAFPGAAAKIASKERRKPPGNYPKKFGRKQQTGN